MQIGRTIYNTINERHIHPKQLYDRLLHEEHERPDERASEELLPRLFRLAFFEDGLNLFGFRPRFSV